MPEEMKPVENESAEGLLREMLDLRKRARNGEKAPIDGFNVLLDEAESFLSRPREAQGKVAAAKLTMPTKVGKIPEHSEVAPGLDVVFEDLFPEFQTALTRSGGEPLADPAGGIPYLLGVIRKLKSASKEMDAIAYAALDNFPFSSERIEWLRKMKAEYAVIHSELEQSAD